MEVDVKGRAVATIAIADAIAIRRKRTAVVRTDAQRERERGVCGSLRAGGLLFLFFFFFKEIGEGTI